MNNDISADFPAYLAAEIRARMQADIPISWLQGCTGDVRANITKRPGLRKPAAFLLSLIYGSPFVADCSIDQIKSMVKPLAARIASAPYQPLALDDSSAARSASSVLRDRSGNTYELPLYFAELGGGFRILGFGGEPFSQYDTELRREFASLWVLGYTNELLGYIPTDEACEKGGYEPGKGNERYGIAAPFEPGTENHLLESARRLIRA